MEGDRVETSFVFYVLNKFFIIQSDSIPEERLKTPTAAEAAACPWPCTHDGVGRGAPREEKDVSN